MKHGADFSFIFILQTLTNKAKMTGEDQELYKQALSKARAQFSELLTQDEANGAQAAETV